ncbi:MAG: hypothetical protein V3V31_04675 [Methylococcales bacterium]
MRWLTDIISSLVGVDIMNPHNIPFAAPLMVGALFGFALGAIVLRWIGNEQKEYRQAHEKTLTE